MYKKYYHPEMSSGVIRHTCGYGYPVDGVPANTSPKGHAGRYALDEGGRSGSSNDWLTVPAQGAAYKCVRVVSKGSQNVAMFETVEPVLLADGEIAVAGMELIHCGNADFNALGIQVGKVFRPGERFYREGTGGTKAAHVHIQAYKGATGGRWHPCKSGYAMDGEAPIHKIAYLPAGHMVVPNGLGYTWQTDREDPIGEFVCTAQGLRRRLGPSTDSPQPTDGWSSVVKKGSRYGVYEVKDGWGRITQDGQWVCMEGYVEYTPYRQPSRYTITLGPVSTGDYRTVTKALAPLVEGLKLEGCYAVKEE